MVSFTHSILVYSNVRIEETMKIMIPALAKQLKAITSIILGGGGGGCGF